MRAAIYIGVSSRDKGQDTANQLAELRDFCKAQGLEVAGSYKHDDHCGSWVDSAKYRAILANAVRRKFDVILFLELDTFTREGALAKLEVLNERFFPEERIDESSANNRRNNKRSRRVSKVSSTFCLRMVDESKWGPT